MAPPTPPNGASDRAKVVVAEARLRSWKEIAAYAEVSVATVQRWEKWEGLPVHRHMHRKLGSVYAFSCEIDEWLRAREALGETEPDGLMPGLCL